MNIGGVGFAAYTNFMPIPVQQVSPAARQASQRPLPEANAAPKVPGPIQPIQLYSSMDGDSVELSRPWLASQAAMPSAFMPPVMSAATPYQSAPPYSVIPEAMPTVAAVPQAAPSLPSVSPDASPKSLIPELPGSGLLDSIKPEGQCRTCAERKYVDGSDDPSVSFQTPTNISPSTAGAAVAAHEQEHVRNEQASAQREGREVVSQTVTLHYDTCPECGKSYVSGGTTRTTTVGKSDNKPTEQTAANDNKTAQGQSPDNE